MNAYKHRIKEIQTINKKNEIVDTKYYVQKRFLFFFWKDINFYDLKMGGGLIYNARYVFKKKTFDDFILAKKALIKSERFKPHVYYNKIIKIGLKDGEIVYFYDLETEYDKNLGLWFKTWEELKNYLDETTYKKEKKYSYIIF